MNKCTVMLLYFSLSSFVCLALLLEFVEGNEFRQFDRRLSFIEDRLSGNKLDIFELQDAINDVKNTISEVKNVCLKNDGENVPKPQAKFVNIPQENLDTYEIMHAFMNEKRWFRREVSLIKRQVQNLPGMWNVHLQNELKAMKKSAVPDNNLQRQMGELEDRVMRMLRDEINIIKRSINDVEDNLKETRDEKLSGISTEMVNMDTQLKNIISVIDARVNYLGDRLTVVENFKDEHIRDLESTMAAIDKINKYNLSSVFGTMSNLNSDINCGTGWKRFQGFCYQFRSDRVVFDDAVKSCEGDDAYLTDIQSQEEDAFIGELGNGRSVWLGSNRQNTWMRTSKSMQYTNWRIPSYERFVHSYSRRDLFTYKSSTGRWWTSYSIRRKLPFVCKRQT